MGVKLTNIEYYLPKGKLSSKDLTKVFVNFDADKVENKIGISNRYVVSESETTLDLAFEASKKILNKVDKDKIDFIILCTQTPDYFLPTGSCILQDRLGLSKSTGALDFNLGCSGYIYGMAITKGLITSGIAKNVLLITADTYTKFIHKNDKGNRSIFGDGASATIITKSETDEIGEFELGTDGSGYDKLIIKNGAGKNKYNDSAEIKTYGDNNQYTDNCIYMNGPEIFNFTIKNIPGLINSVLKKNNIELDDIDYYIFHQANKFMLDYLRRKIGIPEAKFHINLEQTGNTVSSTIPIALNQAIKDNKIQKESKVLIAGFGVGLSWGATVITL